MQRVPTAFHPHFGVYVGWQILLTLLLVGVLGAVAVVSQLGLLYWCASLAVSCLLMSLLMPGRMIHPVKIVKTVSDNAVVGHPMLIRYEVTNTRTFLGVYSLRLVELVEEGRVAAIPRVYIPYLPPGKTVSFETTITPTQRGSMEILGTRLASRYPFGVLTRFRTILDGRKIHVYPALGRLDRRFIPGQKGHEPFATNIQSQYRGNSDEFYALREYQRGDNPRHIHWKRSASMGQLVVREMSQYAPHRLTLVLNTYVRPDDATATERFEQAVSFAATVLCDSLEKGYRTALICAAEQPDIIPPLSGREAQHRVLRTLSAIRSQSDVQLADMIRNWRWTQKWQGRCLVVSLTEVSSSVLDRMSQTIGPVQVLQVGSRVWRKLFISPTELAAATQEAM